LGASSFFNSTTEGVAAAAGADGAGAAGFLKAITAAHFGHWIFSGIGSGMFSGAWHLGHGLLIGMIASGLLRAV
jgi:hypothetical protein